MSEPRLVVNRAKCLECGDETESHHRHDYVTCSCGNVSRDGGIDYIRSCVVDRDKYLSMNLDEDSDFELIRKHLCRGSRGKNGDQPLTWIPLKDIDDDYLVSLIDYKEANGQVTDVHYKVYLKERDYRSSRTVLD